MASTLDDVYVKLKISAQLQITLYLEVIFITRGIGRIFFFKR